MLLERRAVTMAGKAHEGHQHDVEQVMEQMLNEEIVYEVSELFKVLGDSTRVRILTALLEKELGVCCIAESLGMSQSAISHQLRILKQARLVKFRRDGKSIFYSLADDHVKTIFKQAVDHTLES